MPSQNKVVDRGGSYTDGMNIPTNDRPYTYRETDITTTENSGAYILKVRDLEDGHKPRERLINAGPQELSMAELVAVIMGVGTRREDVMVMSRRILKDYGERAIMHESNPVRLAESLQIPLTKACQLVASFEIGRRFYESRAGKPVEIRTAEQAYRHLSGIASMQKEQLRALYLGSRYQLIHEEVISIGSLTANIVHPREVFQPAIQYGAVAVIVAHNHPSGSLEPTTADIQVTSQLVRGGQLLGIELLDHLIITSDAFMSIIGEKND